MYVLDPLRFKCNLFQKSALFRTTGVVTVHLSAIIKILAKRVPWTWKFALKPLLSICWWVLKMVYIGWQGLVPPIYVPPIYVYNINIGIFGGFGNMQRSNNANIDIYAYIHICTLKAISEIYPYLLKKTSFILNKKFLQTLPLFQHYISGRVHNTNKTSKEVIVVRARL